jgi:hypothetical protein
MNDNEMAQAAQISRKQMFGQALMDKERVFLQGLLDRMDKPERAGSIAAIIQIMLDGSAPFPKVLDKPKQ